MFLLSKGRLADAFKLEVFASIPLEAALVERFDSWFTLPVSFQVPAEGGESFSEGAGKRNSAYSQFRPTYKARLFLCNITVFWIIKEICDVSTGSSFVLPN